MKLVIKIKKLKNNRKIKIKIINKFKIQRLLIINKIMIKKIKIKRLMNKLNTLFNKNNIN